MVRKLILAPLIVLNISLFSQQVIISAGEKSDFTDASIQWTLGELVTGAETNGSTILFNGFQQSTLTVYSIPETEDTSIDIKVYPNPTTSTICVEKTSNMHKTLYYQIYGTDGKKYLQGKLSQPKTNIGVLKLNDGVYILNIIDGVKYSSSYRVIKK